MSESTEYLLENIEKTYEIYNAISHMENEILTKFDKAIRKSFSNWVEGEWICTKEENLQDDNCINIVRKEWTFQNENKELKSFIWAYFQLDGDDPIWTFFGLPNEKGNNSVHIHIWLSDEFKQLPGYQKLLEEFDRRNQEFLAKADFDKKGGSVNRWYEKKILFSNTAILNGLKNDDWDEATLQLKEAWQIFGKVEWEFLKKSIKKYKK
jgi:hypothetical protein